MFYNSQFIFHLVRFIGVYFFDVILKEIVYIPFVSVKKCNQFLYINLVAWYFAELVYQLL